MALAVAVHAAALAAAAAGRQRHPPSPPLHSRSATPVGIPLDVECEVNRLAYNWSLRALPQRAPLVEAFDSLRLQRCGPRPAAASGLPTPSPPQLPPGTPAWYVDPAKGDDAADGSLQHPFRSVHRAIGVVRGASSGRPRPFWARVILRAGVHSVGPVPITLTSIDSGLSIEAYPGERPVLSAGVELTGLKWVQVQKGFGPRLSGVNNIMDAAMPGDASMYGPGAQYAGDAEDAAGCEALCSKLGSACTSYTWHDAAQGDFAKQCFVHTDGVWQPARQSGHVSAQRLNVWKASLKGRGLKDFQQLWGGNSTGYRRKVRARFPSANPEERGLWITPFTGYVPSADHWLAPQWPKVPAAEIHIQSPLPQGTDFDAWYIGVGGTLDGRFNPPRSYWGVAKPTGGGGSTYRVPTGLVAKPDTFTDKNWSSAKGAVLHAYQGPHWGDWAFEVDSFDPKTRTINLGRGGFQEARGSDSGAEWYIENLLAELDSPGEWYHDTVAEELYYFPNGTGPPAETLVAAQGESALRVFGSRRDPVTDISVTGITFAHTDATYMQEFMVPSSGDFAVHRGGAVHVEGAERFRAQACTFRSPGGNGLAITGYARNITVEDSEVAWAGENGVVVMGDTALIDGTLGDHPKDVTLRGLLVREVGVYVQQSAAVFVAQSERVAIDRLVAFNGPRQGTVWNDGMFGGHSITNSAIYMMVRSTGDCGPIYAWMRTQALHRRPDGSFTLDGDYCRVESSVLLTNYHGVWPIDLDDGSNRVNASGNVMAWGGYKNYLGNRKTATGNAYIFPDATREPPPPEVGRLGGFFTKPFCMNSDGQVLDSSGWGETWANNVCFINSTDVYELGSCNDAHLKDLVPLTRNNTFYVGDGAPKFRCGGSERSLAEWQGVGEDIGSQVKAPVGAAEVVAIARKYLPTP
eukprot:TRINITY_DN46934_c0_g1_i1.p1 TRINITY_DN46934_c0_g1~~TRINITY_DN46934_c0_g1_i1.p1  ORF type:complete len:941 (+),score=254.23 TRINITY_DN46934_c0_g1_i1:75-2825(+)